MEKDNYHDRGSRTQWEDLPMKPPKANKKIGLKAIHDCLKMLKEPIEAAIAAHKTETCEHDYEPAERFFNSEICKLCNNIREREIPDDRILPRGHPYDEWANR